MVRKYTGRTEDEKQFIQVFDLLNQRHNPWTVWQDFVEMCACAISNGAGPKDEQWNKREDSYLSCVRRYSQEEQKHIVTLFGITTAALMNNPAQDFLGNLYMNLEFGRDWRGQFFTPWNVSQMMALKMLGEATANQIKEEGFISILDCCCGAGCMLIAVAETFRQAHIDYRRDVLFAAQDIDPVVAKMCYIQLSLLDCAGYVVVGNSITHPIAGDALHPVIAPECDTWYMPAWFSPLWKLRGEPRT